MKETMKTLMKWTAVMVLLVSSLPTMAQSGKDCQGQFSADTLNDKKNIAMFNQYLQQKEFGNAYLYWQYLFNNIPCYSKHITYNGPLIIKYYMKDLRASDKDAYEARLEGLIDSVMLCYEYRIKYWGGRGEVLAKWANDLAKLRPDQRGAALQMFAESIDLTGNKTDDVTPIYYLDAAIDEYKKERYTMDSLLMLYFQLREITDYNLAEPASKKDDWVRTDTSILKMIQPYLNPEAIEAFYKPMTDTYPDSLALLKKAQEVLGLAGGNRSDYAFDLAVKLYQLEPSAESAVAIGNSYYARKEKSTAFNYYLKGVDNLKDQVEKADLIVRMADIKLDEGNYSEAKRLAKSALDINPNQGEAYLILATIYTRMAGSCTADNLDGASVYWAAYDMASKAESVDASLSGKASQVKSASAARFPSQEDAFFKGFTVSEGGAFTVPCLGVSTTVRYRK